MKKLTLNDIDRMKSMRDNGMSNSQIALEMHCNIQTVYRHLGRQPAMCRADYGSIIAHVTDAEKPRPAPAADPAVPKRQSTLHMVAQTRILDGTYYQFTVNSYGNISMRLKNPESSLKLDLQGLEKYITELMDAYAELSDCVAREA